MNGSVQTDQTDLSALNNHNALSFCAFLRLFAANLCDPPPPFPPSPFRTCFSPFVLLSGAFPYAACSTPKPQRKAAARAA
jgi:hypothetical protein